MISIIGIIICSFLYCLSSWLRDIIFMDECTPNLLPLYEIVVDYNNFYDFLKICITSLKIKKIFDIWYEDWVHKPILNFLLKISTNHCLNKIWQIYFGLLWAYRLGIDLNSVIWIEICCNSLGIRQINACFFPDLWASFNQALPACFNWTEGLLSFMTLP